MNDPTSPPPNTLLDLASTTTILERLLAWDEATDDPELEATPLTEIVDAAREVMAREHVEPADPIDLKLVPGPCHREIVAELKGITEAVNGVAFILAQVGANGSPIVNALRMLDPDHRPTATPNTDDEVNF